MFCLFQLRSKECVVCFANNIKINIMYLIMVQCLNMNILIFCNKKRKNVVFMNRGLSRIFFYQRQIGDSGGAEMFSLRVESHPKSAKRFSAPGA